MYSRTRRANRRSALLSTNASSTPKKLMLSTDMTMCAISLDCGFSNSSQFASTFRKLTGQTPSAFKRNHFIRSSTQ
uniref:helix-turn-helix domain-containing protein n=1 Tax=Cohnella rhizosphaerae TaxID=1457232 RepID=UPI003B8A7690